MTEVFRAGKLTPERYLTYPVATIQAIPCDDPVEQDGQDANFAYKFKDGYIPHERLLVECLRYARLETLDADDVEILANA